MQIKNVLAVLAFGLPLAFASPIPEGEAEAIPYYPKRDEAIPYYPKRSEEGEAIPYYPKRSEEGKAIPYYMKRSEEGEAIPYYPKRSEESEAIPYYPKRSEEALSNNCRYDSFAAAWLPPHCRNDALIDAFERAGPNPDGSWTYYADRNKTQRLSLEQVSRLPETGGSHFFATHGWHLVHCAYYWKKMFLAPTEGTVIEKRYDNLAHLEHCEMMFLKRDDLDTIVTEAGVSLHSDVAVVVKGAGHEHGHIAFMLLE
ncbi:hypothetical protein P170DRAFT_445064 [Aspergillus steynii IBT 23096]|uniref:Uncharacterized protein n=1 Tax=Aspergillus steynii IBT 23096 TaxID=1392250 RepID=A0A2I2GK73_9EURO|nr:uncharacterized protein P170DRAFT_445064 [Aspergillus steynii IBT 23096]PLB53272.1 hypothetical protein P170DRAFT_445064 [Aspergillus steynii IBT 23096]